MKDTSMKSNTRVSKDLCSASPSKVNSKGGLKRAQRGSCVLGVSPYEQLRNDLLTEQAMDATTVSLLIMRVEGPTRST